MKRFLSLFLALVVAVGICFSAPMTIEAEAATYQVNGVNIPVSGYEVGNAHDNCWEFAQDIYGKLWPGKGGFTSYRGTSDDMLRNVSTDSASRAITAENTKKFISAAALGSVVRVCSMDYMNSDDGWGHSFILVQKDENGFTAYQGNYVGKIALTYYTWNSYVSEDKNYNHLGYFKYIKWPGAPAFGDSIPKPQNVKLTASATSIPVNGSITFNVSADNADPTYWIGIDDEAGNRIHTEEIGSSFTYKCTSPGKYSAYVSASNSGGWTNSSRVYWTVENITRYTVTYNANGGTGAPASQTKEQGVPLTLSSTVPTRTGYTFLGWGTSTGDTSVNYAPGATYSDDADITLYAIWQCNHTSGTTIVKAKDPTYTEEGYTGDTKCNTCGETVSTGTTIPMLTLGKPTTSAYSTGDGVKVTWNAVDGAKSYKIFRKELNGSTWSAWTSPASGVTGTSYTDKTAKLGVTYIYAVSAVNASQTSSFTQCSAFKHSVAPAVTVSNSGNGIKVSWNAINGAASYKVFRRAYNESTKTYGGWSVLAQNYTSTSYNDTLCNLGVTYSYAVVAVNGSYSSDYKASANLKFNPALNATVKNTDAGIRVEWSKIFGATSYKVFRRELDTTNNTWGGWASVTTGYTGSAFVDKTAKLGVTYSYAVVAVNSTTSSNYVATAGLKCDIPTKVTATSTTSAINLTWNKVNGATGYTIYRKAFNATNNTWGSWSVLKTGYTGTSYNDTLGNLGASYIYCVRATVGSFSGSYVQSSAVKCNVVPKTTINNTTNGIKVSWSQVFGATSYKIFRRELNTTNNTWGSWASIASGLTGSAYVDKTSKLGVTYSYAVVAVNSTASSSYVATSGLKCDPIPTVSVANTQTGVTVKWNAVNGAKSYTVYRKALNTTNNTWSDWSALKSGVTTTSYNDTLGNLGVTYIYSVRVTASNGFVGGYAQSAQLKCNIPPKVTVANSSTGVKVSWSNVFGATSYKVFRRELNTSTNTWSGWMSPASGLTGSVYVDTTAKLGVTYSYAVVASNSTASSSYVATSGLKCNMAPTVKIANATNGVKITWNAINGAGSYKIYRKELNTATNTWSGWMSPASGVTGTSYVDKTAKLGVKYIYTVAAVGNGLTSNFVATSELQFNPTPTVTIGTATNGIRVNWNAINGADSYIVYKKTYNAKTGKWGTWTTVAQNYKGTTVVDTSAVNGTYYMYTVRATKGAFNSSFTQSNVVKYVK